MPNLRVQLIVVYFVSYAVGEEHQVGERRRILTEADQEKISRWIAVSLEGNVIAPSGGPLPGLDQL